MEEPVHVLLLNSYKYTFFLDAFPFVSPDRDPDWWKNYLSKLPEGLRGD
jgi:hypothetical protein